MKKAFAIVFVLAVFAGCSGTKKLDNRDIVINNAPEKPHAVTPPGFDLPGVPLKDAPPAAPTAEEKPEAAAAPAAGETSLAGIKPAEAAPDAGKPVEAEPAGVAPVQAKPAEAVTDINGDLKFHMAAAKRYSVRKKYRSAAAEYGAALEFLPAGDVNAVRLLEREGTMTMKAGDTAKAQEYFLSAVRKAGELNTSGNGLAEAYLGLGYSLEKDKKTADAIAAYEKALELSGSKTVKDRISTTISRLKERSQ